MKNPIIGFFSFGLMVAFGVCDLVTAFWDMDPKNKEIQFTHHL